MYIRYNIYMFMFIYHDANVHTYLRINTTLKTALLCPPSPFIPPFLPALAFAIARSLFCARACVCILSHTHWRVPLSRSSVRFLSLSRIFSLLCSFSLALALALAFVLSHTHRHTLARVTYKVKSTRLNPRCERGGVSDSRLQAILRRVVSITLGLYVPAIIIMINGL